MISYRGRTYCPFIECKNVNCSQRLTDEIKNDARRWWGSENAPIICFAERPECFEVKNE